MCTVIEAADMARRTLLRRAGLAAGVAAGAAMTHGTAAHAVAASSPSVSNEAARRFRTRLALLGTAAGRTWWGGSQRQGTSSAVVVDDAVYLIDFGDGWGRRYLQAGLGRQEEFHGLERLEAAFVTHLHSDHVVDYPNLLVFGATDGLTARKSPVSVYGPGRRGSLPPVFGNPPSPPPVINPDNPMPGLEDMTEYLYWAFASDLNDNMRDSLKPDPHTLIRPHDIVLPDGLVDDPNHDPAPTMSPIKVYEDERVQVTATLVRHPPVFPSFGYRFDSEDGSIVFSGDTSVSENLIRLAEGADILVHEVIDPQWVEELFPDPPTPAQQAKMEHLLRSHTTIDDVGRVAERASVKTLVLSHLAPAENSPSRWMQAQKHFSGKLVVGNDLDQFGVGMPTS